MAVEELDDAGGRAERGGALQRLRVVDGVDEPDAVVAGASAWPVRVRASSGNQEKPEGNVSKVVTPPVPSHCTTGTTVSAQLYLLFLLPHHYHKTLALHYHFA